MGKSAFFALLIVVLALLACAGASHTRIADDMFAIKCKRNAENCYTEAAEVCPAGFDVVDNSQHSGAIATTNYNGNTANTTVTPVYNGEMLVRCRRSEVPATLLATEQQAPAKEPPPAPLPACVANENAFLFPTMDAVRTAAAASKAKVSEEDMSALIDLLTALAPGASRRARVAASPVPRRSRRGIR